MDLVTLLNEIEAWAKSRGLTLEEALGCFRSQLGSDHGVQVAIGHYVEHLVETELQRLSHLLSYRRADEKTEKGDFHVSFHSHPDIVIVIEAKTGQWRGSYTRKHDIAKNPNGSVSVGVCKSRLTGIAKLYERRRFHAVVTGFCTDDAGWLVRACLTSDMPAHRKHPEMLGERQTFALDMPNGKWRMLVEVLEDALRYELTFARRAFRWLA
jgi:hypothetical protein